jgi:undecaprenyl-diphosphatase
MDWLLSLDTDLFILLNTRLTHPLLDRMMSGVTTQSNWYPVLAGAWIALIIWGGRRGRMAAVMLVIALALSDQITCSVLKPLVGRLRPCNALTSDQCRLLVGASSAKSFPSAHASNSFVMATVAAWGHRRLAPVFFVVAALVAYSRIYVGLHYPLDAVAGAALGVLIGRITIWVVVRLWRLWDTRRAAAIAAPAE